MTRCPQRSRSPRSSVRAVAVLAIGLGLGFASAAAAGAATVEIRGLRSFPEAEARQWITDQIELIGERGASAARADDGAFFLQQALRARGFPRSTVRWDWAAGDERIVLEVDEGATAILGTIDVEGNSQISDEVVRDVLTADTRERLNLGGDDPVPFVRRDIDAGIAHVRELLRVSGFREVVVDATVGDPAAGKPVDVGIVVTEGRRFMVGEIREPDYPDAGFATAADAAIADERDDPFSVELVANVGRRIGKVAAERGYLDAEVDSRALEPRRTGGGWVIDIEITATWGELSHVEDVVVEGADRVKDAYFRRQFGELEGRPFSQAKVSEITGEMLRTGAFNRVAAVPESRDDGGVTLKVEVEEADRWNLGVYGGYGTYEGGIAGVTVRQVNLFGMVRSLEGEIEFNQRGGASRLAYGHDRILGTRIDGTIETYGDVRIHEGYSVRQGGIRGTLEREFREGRHRISLAGEVSYQDVYEADIEEAFLGKRQYVHHRLGAIYRFSTLDDELNPGRGLLLVASVSGASKAIGSEVEYVRWTLQGAWHRPLWWEHTLRLGARAGIITPFGESDSVPIDLRFFSGGSRSVRSFRDRDLGPKDPGGYPVGGEFGSTFTAEYEIPVWGGLRLAAFADAGNLLEEAGDAGLDEMHYAAGAGLRYALPIGPLRFDYGYNLNRGEREPEGTFHFAFGFAF